MSMSSPTNKDVSKLADGSVNNTEFECLDGITGNIETRLAALEAGGTPELVYATKSSQQTGITAQVWTKVTGWTEHEDTANAFASDQFVAPADGLVEIAVNVIGGTFGGGSTTQGFYVALFKAGVIIPESVSGNFIEAGWGVQSNSIYRGSLVNGESLDVRFIFATNNTNAIAGAFTDALGATDDATIRSQLMIKFTPT